MERYSLTILLITFFVPFAEERYCEHQKIQYGKETEIDCTLPKSCTMGKWTKTGLSAKSKTLSAKNCNRCEGKFNVTDYKLDTKAKYKTSLKFLNASWSVKGIYNCSCENSSQNSDKTNDFNKCYIISVYMDCYLEIAIDKAKMVIQGKSLTETMLHSLAVTEGDKVSFKCSNYAGMEMEKGCTEFENGNDVTIDKSHHQCKVTCVREAQLGSKTSDACKVTVLLNVGDSKSSDKKSSDTRGFLWSILILNVIVLLIFCSVFLYGFYLFCNKLGQRASAKKRVSSHNGESFYATVAPASQRRDARSGRTLTSTNTTWVNPLGEIEEETNIGISPYLVSESDSYFQNANSLSPGGDSVDTIQVRHGVKSKPDASKEPLEGYTPMASPNGTLQRPKPDEIDLYFFEEYSSVPEL